MKDFINQELHVGELVVHAVGARGGGLSGPHRIVGFTAQMVKIDQKKPWRKEPYSLVAPHCCVRLNHG